MRNLGVDYLFHEIELPLAGVLADMETEGVAIDVTYLKEMQDELGAQLTALETEVAEVAGQRFNLNAPQQLAKVLFEDLRLPVGRRTKTGYSTDADTLEALREKHPIVGLILEHRQLSKLKSTYVDALPQLVDPLSGRVHTSFGQASTATGRLSSSNPNLMNIPIRTELGQRIRRAFTAGHPRRRRARVPRPVLVHLRAPPRVSRRGAAQGARGGLRRQRHGPPPRDPRPALAQLPAAQRRRAHGDQLPDAVAGRGHHQDRDGAPASRDRGRRDRGTDAAPGSRRAALRGAARRAGPVRGEGAAGHDRRV